MTQTLTVFLNETPIGTLTLLAGDRSFFAFAESYLNNPHRPILSQSFLSASGELISQTKTTQTKLPPFFSNLLPEGHLRTYLAARAGIKSIREFPLIQLLGNDLPGAVVIQSNETTYSAEEKETDKNKIAAEAYRFSLAGVQLKFSALAGKKGGLTIPTHGIGGDWIIKLPAHNFSHVPENEWAMLHLAAEIGISTPEIKLISLDQIRGLPILDGLASNQALAIKRFDRILAGKTQQRIHTEDFAQVYNLFPDEKYSKVSYTNIAKMIWALTGESGLIDFIQRLVFTIIIGNGDMHLKNWSFIYPDGKTPQLAPAYDFVSTIPYMPEDQLALSLSGNKDMKTIELKHFVQLAKKANLPEYLVLNTVKQTLENTFSAWAKNKKNYELPILIKKSIDLHMSQLKIKAR